MTYEPIEIRAHHIEYLEQVHGGTFPVRRRPEIEQFDPERVRFFETLGEQRDRPVTITTSVDYVCKGCEYNSDDGCTNPKLNTTSDDPHDDKRTMRDYEAAIAHIKTLDDVLDFRFLKAQHPRVW